MPDPPPRVYARQLLPFGYGCPLWTPEPGNQLLRYRQDGLRIGDVGVIVPENGSFDVFFNICLPRDHLFHRVNGVPDDFVHVPLDELDVAVYPHAENPGSVISTSSVTTLRTIEPPDSAHNALTYEFSLSSSEGALLILPEGAESYSLLKRKVFKDVATRNGAEWYNFAEQQLGRIITHDSLYLITGCYKSHSWSVAAFHQATSQTGATEFPAQFKAGQARQGDVSVPYTWETTRALHWRVGPLGDWTAIPSQAVFISGFKIAIRDNILGRRRVEVEVDAPPTRLKPAKLHGSSGRGHSRTGKLWRRLVNRSGGEWTEEQAEADIANDPGTTAVDGPKDAVEQITVSHEPETPQSFHPSDIINRYLLSKEPSAAVAVTHDSQWNILIEKGILKPEDLGDDTRLESIVSENYRSVLQDGVACLQSTSDCSIRLKGIDDVVRQAWKEDKLDDAEEILSRQITRRTSSDHSAFANRALIRARLRHWDAALRDAETSINIHPSVTAHVAQGFAMFGQQKYALAVYAFNVALRECDTCDRVFVELVKSIVLFETGNHAESMAGMADLIEKCPTEMKSICSAAMAEMCVRLATLAMKKKDSDRALQLLSRAQSLGPFRTVPESMEVVSMICGWRLDNLCFSIHQQKCEVLYDSGRVNEAVESLREMTRDLGEELRTAKDNSGWITTFTHRCLKSLENLGDSALASRNYAEAVTHYSATLLLGPEAREDILVKRSSAHAAMGAWDGALNDADEAITLNPLSPWGHERRLAALQGMGRHDETIQAFNSMLSILERVAHPYIQQLHPEHTGETMAIQRIDPRLQTPHHYQPRRNLDHKEIIGSIMAAMQDIDPQRASNMLDTLRAERDDMVRERMVLPPVDQPDRPEQQHGAVNETLGTGFDERLREQIATSERYQKLHDQLSDLVRQSQGDEKMAPELMKMALRLAEQQLILRPQDEQNKVPVFDLLDELHLHNAKQKELLDALSGYWGKSADSSKGKEQERGGTDHDQLPYVFRSLREDFIDALATEAQMIVREVASLGAERSHLQHELGSLMWMKARYGPGGEFDPDWKPPPPPPPPPLPPGVPEKISRDRLQKEPTRPGAPAPPSRTRSTDPGSTQSARPGWRSIDPVVNRKPPTVGVARVGSGSAGLLGPLTPRGASLLDVGSTLEPKAVPTDVDSQSSMVARHTSPSDASGFEPRRDEVTPSSLPSSEPGLDGSWLKFDPHSAPSPLSLTFSPLYKPKSETLK